MNQWTSLYAPLIGRILLGGFFLAAGLQKIVNFGDLVEYFARYGMPEPVYAALAVVIIETLAAIGIIADIKTRTCALVLALYLLISSVIFFGVTTVQETQIFLENMALVGGLLILSSTGSSSWTPRWLR